MFYFIDFQRDVEMKLNPFNMAMMTDMKENKSTQRAV